MLKRTFYIAILVLGMAIMPVYATAVGTVHINVNVPFSFIVDGNVFPPGDYRIVQLDGSDNMVWKLQNVQNARKEILFTTEQENAQLPKAETYLTFTEINNNEYLSDFWAVGRISGWHVPVQLEPGVASESNLAVRKVKANSNGTRSS